MMELLSIFTAAKEAGFEVGTIASIMTIAFILRKDVKKEIGKIVEAINGHNTRLLNLETDVQGIKKKLMNEDKNKTEGV